MAYTIRWRHTAEADLRSFRNAAAASAIRRAVDRFLADTPTLDEGARKRLDPNPLDAGWRLRVGEYRVLYDVDEEAGVVDILPVGHKPRETLHIQGRPIVMRVD